MELSEPGPAAKTVNFSVTEKGLAPVLVRAEVPEAFAPDTRGPVNVVELSGVPVNKAFAVLRKVDSVTVQPALSAFVVKVLRKLNAPIGEVRP